MRFLSEVNAHVFLEKVSFSSIMSSWLCFSVSNTILFLPYLKSDFSSYRLTDWHPDRQRRKVFNASHGSKRNLQQRQRKPITAADKVSQRTKKGALTMKTIIDSAEARKSTFRTITGKLKSSATRPFFHLFFQFVIAGFAFYLLLPLDQYSTR